MIAKVEATRLAFALVQVAIAIVWVGVALRDRRRAPGARGVRGPLWLALGVGYGMVGLVGVLLAVRG